MERNQKPCEFNGFDDSSKRMNSGKFYGTFYFHDNGIIELDYKIPCKNFPILLRQVGFTRNGF